MGDVTAADIERQGSLFMSDVLLSVLDPDSLADDEASDGDGHVEEHVPVTSRVDVRVLYTKDGGTCQSTKVISGDLLSLRSGKLWSVSIGVSAGVAHDITRVMGTIDSISISFADDEDADFFSTFVVDETVVIDIFAPSGSRSGWIFNVAVDERLLQI